MTQQTHHFTTVDELSEGSIHALLQDAAAFKEGERWIAPERPYVANLFYEPSTRTKMSFEVAQKRLGFHVLDIDADTSSVQKGESLYDTVRTLQAIGASAVVARHFEKQFYEQLGGITIPVINAGDGEGEHPSQCLLDLMTIKEEFQTFAGLNVAMIGDIRHSRVARSNIEALKRLGANVQLAGPEDWMDPSMRCPHVSVDTAVKQADVVMLLRVQHERHAARTASQNAERYHEQFGLTEKREKKMKPGAIIMHPGPFNRGVEIASSLVEAPRSRIFKQVENGVYVRMAILKHVCEQSKAHQCALKGVL
ncbi:aspartate carbamoyltransferase catalytic subunit [Salicibibacter halophilus]|uniref:Aspartate carbamoyltransferase n=1 Tax=Salicibibacter halophilus TaxID=2502791 RepID=A0A514LFG0_9BACI|nr:aspartate carbamoyltransferase catalytic subunit [Salicibibacter halophilus]QDI90584.1 aspartate carbamoyltransferase catalytic subunit [Salicibibacter halophilus]